jgi:molybdopterin molybdotransferase
VGLLASLGRSFVAIHRRPRVAILSGGDELVEPDQDAAGGRIVASNAWSLAAQCTEAGALATNLGIARDTEQDLERLLRAGLASDVLLSSAGVSVGDHDHVRPVLEKLGCRLVFWGVEMKPGYPFTFGRFDEGPWARSAGTGAGPLVFGLPGNPVSALVSFEQFVRPALLRLAGRRTLTRPLLRVQLGETLRKKAGRLHFVRVTLAREGERFVARSTGNQSSGVLRSMALAQGLLVFPAAATELAAGSSADVQLLDADVLAAPEPDPG